MRWRSIVDEMEGPEMWKDSDSPVIGWGDPKEWKKTKTECCEPSMLKPVCVSTLQICARGIQNYRRTQKTKTYLNAFLIK